MAHVLVVYNFPFSIEWRKPPHECESSGLATVHGERVERGAQICCKIIRFLTQNCYQ
jgi:hypothetical protein